MYNFILVQIAIMQFTTMQIISIIDMAHKALATVVEH